MGISDLISDTRARSLDWKEREWMTHKFTTKSELT